MNGRIGFANRIQDENDPNTFTRLVKELAALIEAKDQRLGLKQGGPTSTLKLQARSVWKCSAEGRLAYRGFSRCGREVLLAVQTRCLVRMQNLPHPTTRRTGV